MKIIFENKDKVYTINEVAQEANLHPQTLRNWEKHGLLKPQRISGNQRVYMREDLERIEKICQLKDEGFNIKAIKHFLNGEE
jgi:DNA-binding transcriptional MerR regulator